MADWAGRVGTSPLIQAPIATAERAGTRSARVTGGVRVPRIPSHVVALIGLSTCGYAGALAGVTALQSATDAQTMADRAPLAAAVEAVTDRSDRLAARLAALAAAQASAADVYDGVTAAIAAAEGDLGGLSTSVAGVDGASRSLPTRVALPPAVRTTVRSSGTTTAHATTGGSGKP
jgi:hypothetical protein